jgi:hypothetical protein
MFTSHQNKFSYYRTSSFRFNEKKHYQSFSFASISELLLEESTPQTTEACSATGGVYTQGTVQQNAYCIKIKMFFANTIFCAVLLFKVGAWLFI